MWIHPSITIYIYIWRDGRSDSLNIYKIIYPYFIIQNVHFKIYFFFKIVAEMDSYNISESEQQSLTGTSIKSGRRGTIDKIDENLESSFHSDNKYEHKVS